MAIKERDVKEYFLKMVASIGGLARKIKYENRNGCPDWMVTHEGIYLVELKRPKGGLTIIQNNERNRILKHGGYVYVVHSYDEVDDFIEDIK